MGRSEEKLAEFIVILKQKIYQLMHIEQQEKLYLIV